MKLPVSWLKEYVPIAVPLEELAHRLTMAGLEVASVTRIGGDWQHVTVARVVAVEKHPNADKLKLATVDLGGEQMTVVCGAPNVAAGQKVAFARVGARLIDPRTGQPRKLEAAKIRGVLSAGMVCSEAELGLSKEHEGILTLPEDAPVGAPLADYMGDAVFDFSITPNRPDGLSVLGIAREVAAIQSAAVAEPPLDYEERGAPIAGQAAIEIAAPDLCPRYCASLVTGVKVGPSPAWMQERLAAAGMRPINNIVDITNYVMLEFGQPLHAFDFATLRGGKVIVRRAKPGERITTLDGVERTLDGEMLVIADAVAPVALAGVMGGAATEVTGATATVLLESANFLNASIRRTSALTKLRSEASLRFEKGLSQELPLIALRRATKLFAEVCGATAAAGFIDVFPGKRERVPIVLTRERVRKVLGIDPSAQELASVLGRLGFHCQAISLGGSTGSPRTKEKSVRPELVEGRAVRQAHHERDKTVQDEQQEVEALEVAVPWWRTDVALEDDLCEEYARLVGYDTMPMPMPGGRVPLPLPDPLRQLKERVRDLLVGGGLQEVVTYSLLGKESLDKVGAAATLPQPVRLSNPMSAEQEYLRTTLRPSLLTTLAYNARHGEESVALFEIGRVYLPHEPARGSTGPSLRSGLTAFGLPPRTGASPLPLSTSVERGVPTQSGRGEAGSGHVEGRGATTPLEERDIAAGVLAGRAARSWSEAERDVSFFDAKGVVELALERLQVSDVSFEPVDDPDCYPGRCAAIRAGKVIVGVLGEVRADVLDRFDCPLRPAFYYELDLSKLLASRTAGPAAGARYKPFSRYPGVTRDMALVLDKDIPAQRVEDLIRSFPQVSQVTLFDVYTGDKVPAGKKSLAYRIVYLSPERTLTGEEVSAVQAQVLAKAERELGATLR